MRNYYKLCVLFLFFFLSIAVSYAQSPAQAKKRIGIFLWNNDQRYMDAKAVILEELKKEGFTGPNTEFILGLADGNKAKALEISQNFAALKLDMCISFGTPGTQVLMKEIKDIPIIFSIVYDPVLSKIAASWESSGNNTTGTSTSFPMTKIINKLLELSLTVKNIAVIYVPGESNSVSQLKNLQKLEGEFPLKFIPVPVKSKEEVRVVLPYAVEKIDAIYISGSTVSIAAIADIVEIANKAKKITFCIATDYVPKGALLGLGIDYGEAARSTAKKAILVLRGAAPSSIPIGVPQKFEVMVNMKTAKAAGIKVPLEFLKSAIKIIE